MRRSITAPTRLVQVAISVPALRVGQSIAHAALGAHLAACVQILGPMTSHYLWKGREETARERLLLIKTHRSCVAPLARLVRTLHPYEIPEIVVLPIIAADAAYARWVEQEVRPGRRPRRPR